MVEPDAFTKILQVSIGGGIFLCGLWLTLEIIKQATRKRNGSNDSVIPIPKSGDQSIDFWSAKITEALEKCLETSPEIKKAVEEGIRAALASRNEDVRKIFRQEIETMMGAMRKLLDKKILEIIKEKSR